MKQVHNVRFTAHCDTPQAREDMAKALREWIDAEIPPALFEFEDLESDRYDTLYALKLWLDRQPPVRAVLERLKQLPETDRKKLLHEAELRLDERLNFYFRLDKQSILDHEPKVVDRGDVVQVRINVAAFPKTPEGVVEQLRDILQTFK